MNSFSSIMTLVFGLAIGVSALAQGPPPGGPPPPPPSARFSGSVVTQSSSIRAFNPGPDGQPRSLYPANGSVVDLPPDLGQPMTLAVRKGERISVSGLRTVVNRQTVLVANSITLHGQTLLSRIGPDTVSQQLAPPHPPRAGDPRHSRTPQGGADVANVAPQGPDGARPGQAPPPPIGPLAPRAHGDQPPPPAPPVSKPSNPPVTSNGLPAPPAAQPIGSMLPPPPPVPNGPVL